MNVDELWCKMSHFPTGGVRSKKFEQISPKICRKGGIPPEPPFRPPRLEEEAKRTISSFSLMVNSFLK
jgi:hypothetical protein